MENSQGTQHQLAGDIIFGAEAIASSLGMPRRRVYYLITRSLIPVFRIGHIICARRSTLTRWLNELEGEQADGGVHRVKEPDA
jgi:hypothetical protein